MELNNLIGIKTPLFKSKAVLKGVEKEINFFYDFKDKKIILYFYSKDLTLGCSV